MPFVAVPKDLTKVKTKVALNLTKRQLICFSIAAVVGIPTYIFTRGFLGNEGGVLLMIVLMLPFFFFAMYEKDGQNAEQIARNIIRTKFLWCGIRPYKTENLYTYLKKEVKIVGEQKQTTSKAAKTSVRSNSTGKKG